MAKPVALERAPITREMESPVASCASNDTPNGLSGDASLSKSNSKFPSAGLKSKPFVRLITISNARVVFGPGRSLLESGRSPLKTTSSSDPIFSENELLSPSGDFGVVDRLIRTFESVVKKGVPRTESGRNVILLILPAPPNCEPANTCWYRPEVARVAGQKFARLIPFRVGLSIGNDNRERARLRSDRERKPDREHDRIEPAVRANHLQPPTQRRASTRLDRGRPEVP